MGYLIPNQQKLNGDIDKIINNFYVLINPSQFKRLIDEDKVKNLYKVHTNPICINRHKNSLVLKI